ncbi:MAG: hypothetical protein KDC04_01825 [Saprospiraceae bacterium]|nr:hypothetical protein [Saprospiraceae bacterium]
MKIYHGFLVVLIVFGYSTNAIGQKTKTKKNSDVEIIDFGGTENRKKTREVSHPIILKTSPIMPLFGKALVEAEYGINDYLSLEVGVGPTFKSVLDQKVSFLDELYGSDYYCESTNWSYDVCDDFSDLSIRKQGVGLRFELEPKLYLASEALEGTSISLVLRYTNNNFKAQPVSGAANSYTRLPEFSFKENQRFLDYIVRLNYQTLFPKLSFEYFLGGGIRKENSLRQDIGADNAYSAVGSASVNSKRSYFVLDFGMRIGFQL